MKYLFTLLAFVGLLPSLFSQELSFGKKIVDTLTSKEFWGRGYTKNGMKKAATFLAEEFKQYGLQPLNGSSYYQTFFYPVNTFPGKMELQINGKDLVPGKDFIVSAESKSLKSSGKLEQKDSVQFLNLDKRLIIKLEDKLTMEVAPEQADSTFIKVDKKSISGLPESFKINVESKLEERFEANNICAMVKGTEQPETYLVITAHYDHLGGLGDKTFFPGANDNASGVSLLLNMAQYYAKHPQKYSIVFLLFAGEEAGLLGSKYFTDHPLMALNKIRFLINTDLAGTGEEGITVVNATEFSKEFKWMNEINDEKKLLVKINARGKAANSDHYFFTEKGVPCFYFYTLGGIKAYHDVWDIADTLPLNEHEDLFKLLVSLFDKIQSEK